ncbi:hypothetical protein Aperf_G00000095093 [Anoplocephala perfoliata]
MTDSKRAVDLHKLPEKIMAIIVSSPEPVTQKHFEEQLPDVTVVELLPVLNQMQKKGQLEVLINPDRTLSWRMREIGNIDKIKSLTDVEESLVYNSIRKNGNEGATVKTISIDTKLPQNKLPRLLKSLIGRKMIKELPVLAGKKQKVYLLAELEPSKTLAANTLFAGESGVDVEFVAMLRTACLKYLSDKSVSASKITDPYKRRIASYVSAGEIHGFITSSKLCTVPLTPSDVKTVLDALYFGGELERKQSAAAATVVEAIIDEEVEVKPSNDDGTQNCRYRLAPRTSGFSFLAGIPCIFALNRKRSRAGGTICPPECPVYAAFLEDVDSSSSSANKSPK